jgi:tripeptidyl-peptidase-1
VSAVSGTSASAPVFAGFLSLINAERFALGEPAVGFVNPALYAGSTSSNFVKDITSGLNNCVVSSYTPCCTQGFYAAVGWDPATGLGSVDFTKMAAYFMALVVAPTYTVQVSQVALT